MNEHWGELREVGKQRQSFPVLVWDGMQHANCHWSFERTRVVKLSQLWSLQAPAAAICRSFIRSVIYEVYASTQFIFDDTDACGVSWR